MNILEWARKVQVIAQNGLAFSRDPYDRERYEQLQELVASILSTEFNISAAEAKAFWRHEEGYATPKIDVRGAVFVDNKVLLVQEHSDGKWTLPGAAGGRTSMIPLRKQCRGNRSNGFLNITIEMSCQLILTKDFH